MNVEYMVKHVGYPDHTPDADWFRDASLMSEFVSDYLNEMAEDGWTVHSMSIHPAWGHYYVFLFERPKIEEGD